MRVYVTNNRHAGVSVGLGTFVLFGVLSLPFRAVAALLRGLVRLASR